MTIPTRVLARIAGLRPALSDDGLTVERGVRVPAPDGIPLLTDLYLPRLKGPLPTILLRCPYGRGGPWALDARVFAERGYNAVLQSCRGTFGSGGRIDLSAEAADGRATADWIIRQRWSNKEIGTFGPSYLSFVQWALASTRPPQLKAMAIQIMAADRRRSIYPGGSFALDTALSWSASMANQEASVLARLRGVRARREAMERAQGHLPLQEADRIATGTRFPPFRDWLEHEQPGDAYWKPLDYSRIIPGLGLPVSMVGGWYDYYLPYMLDDHAALVSDGAPVELVIGPWTHSAPAGMLAGLRRGLEWFDRYLLGDRDRPSAAPVRVGMTGPDRGWRDLAAWPPPSTARRWYLRGGGGLALGPPPASEPDRYRYDPAHPTPALGGTTLSGRRSGARDNRALEARADVLVFTSEALDTDVEIIGPVTAELFVSSSRDHTDFFARLCDVEPRGRSTNVCDALLRLQPGDPVRDDDGVARITIELWPAAHRFRKGHRIRLQVSSGAHPRFARNPGSGERLATATTLLAADQAVYHDPAHPSAVVLPVLTA
jgi:putative CocE/NonD family hydrolase